jgi:uncharacterized protein
MTEPVQDALQAFHVMVKPSGPLCNLDCKYCFYLEKEELYPDQSRWAMPETVLESYIRQYIEAQDVPSVHFAWQGGEPTLLGIEFFRKVTALQSQYAGGKEIANSMQTNGVLLDDPWGEFLAENRFLVGLSIDGPREMHDYYRVDKGGAPTFERVMRGLSVLQKHRVEFNTLTCVQRHNSRYPLEVYRFLKQIGSRFMQFIPVVERISRRAGPDGLTLISPGNPAEATLTEWSVGPLQYGRFLSVIFDEWVRGDVGRYFVQLFDVALEAWAGLEPSLCVFRERCGEAMALEHNGDLYSCDHYVYPENRLGNILSQPMTKLARSAQQRKFGDDKLEALPAHCRECDVRFVCHGECPKHRFARTPDGEPGLNHLCPGYKHFFRHIDPYMKFMAEQLSKEQAPARVMEWVRQRDSSTELQGPRPGH